MKTTLASTLLAFALLYSTGCAVSSNHRIEEGSVHRRSYTSVSGDIEIGRQARVRDAKTVSGDIEVGDGSQVRKLATVSGDIRLGQGVTVDGSVKTVSGDIDISEGCTINGNVSAVAAELNISGSHVSGDVRLVQGKVTTSEARVTGALRIGKTKDKDADVVEIDIGPNSEIASIYVEAKANARLRIHRSASVGTIEGVSPEYYD